MADPTRTFVVTPEADPGGADETEETPQEHQKRLASQRTSTASRTRKHLQAALHTKRVIAMLPAMTVEQLRATSSPLRRERELPGPLPQAA
jgi:hypothetical protein